jgi:quinol monooxygenase YgiN
MIYVVATIQLTNGHRDEFLALQKDLLPLVHAEKGCVEYSPSIEVPWGDPAKSTPRDSIVVMHERWETLEDLKAHSAAQHMADFRQKTKHLVLGVKIEVFKSA